MVNAIVNRLQNKWTLRKHMYFTLYHYQKNDFSWWHPIFFADGYMRNPLVKFYRGAEGLGLPAKIYFCW